MLNLNFSPFPTLSTERATLRQFTPEDENEIFIMRSDEEMNRYTGIPKATGIEDARKFIERINNNIRNNESLMWGITLKDDNSLIGTICFWNIVPEKDQAEIGYVLLPQYQGKGIMQEAVTKVIEFGFTAMQLRSIVADLDPNNLRSVKLLERAGFVLESSATDKMIYMLVHSI